MKVALVFLACFLIGCERFNQVELECRDREVMIHLETLGEYPTQIHRLRLSRTGEEDPIWEVVREEGNPHLWNVVLQVGSNPAQLEGVASGGSYRVIAPLTEPSFELEGGVPHELVVWSTEFTEKIVFTATIEESGTLSCVSGRG